MIATLNAPKNDRFQVISEHTRETLFIDPTYLDIERTATRSSSRSPHEDGQSRSKRLSTKPSLTAARARRLRREDVFINLVEVKKENWSFGTALLSTPECAR